MKAIKSPSYFKGFRAFELSSFRAKNGFTLLEVIIVLAILAVISAISFNYLGGFKTASELDESANLVVGKLREAQNKAMTGEDNISWGVHFDNTIETEPYYELFSGASYAGGTIVEKIYLTNLVPSARFTTPASGASVNVIFSKITGSPASAQNIVIDVQGSVKTISVEMSGRIKIN